MHLFFVSFLGLGVLMRVLTVFLAQRLVWDGFGALVFFKCFDCKRENRVFFCLNKVLFWRSWGVLALKRLVRCFSYSIIR